MRQDPLWVGNNEVDISPQTSTLKMEAAWPPKHWFPTTKLHTTTTQKTTTLKPSAVQTQHVCTSIPLF